MILIKNFHRLKNLVFSLTATQSRKIQMLHWILFILKYFDCYNLFFHPIYQKYKAWIILFLDKWLLIYFSYQWQITDVGSIIRWTQLHSSDLSNMLTLNWHFPIKATELLSEKGFTWDCPLQSHKITIYIVDDFHPLQGLLPRIAFFS